MTKFINLNISQFFIKKYNFVPKKLFLYIFYIFVSLNGLETPSYHIVPSCIIAKSVKESHEKWLKSPGRNGQQHKDNNIRKFKDEKDLYLNRWDLFE